MAMLLPYSKHVDEPQEIQLLRFVRLYLGRPGDHEELGMWFEEVDDILRKHDLAKE